MCFDFPGVTMALGQDALVLTSQHPLEILSSAVVGGGFRRARYILSRHVHKDYSHPQPAEDLQSFAHSQGITEPFIGQMTAVPLYKARSVTARAGDLTVAVVVTAGLSNAATPGLSPPVWSRPGTVNLTVLIDAHLSPAAMVNAVITATEVKTQVILARGVRTPEGHLATGTSTDAIVVACTGRGGLFPYAGPVTPLGWLLGRSVRAALEAALQERRPHGV
jgi:iron complex transport system ATP-binding protein